jgi:flavin reductase (DIM6/NTAB) family NADH-FMN oxidoreductase RutF
MNELPLSKAYRFIEPGPVVLVTTANEERANIMTMSWHMVMDFTPLIGCIIGPWDYSFTALSTTRECVIAIPTVDLASKVVEIGNCSGDEIDKFDAFGLTPVADTSMVDKYNLFILEVVKAWTDPEREERRTIHHNGDGTFVVDGRTINLKAKMVKWQAHL